MPVKNDPQHYARCSEPHETKEKAESAIASFIEAIDRLRVAHQIPDVVIAVGVRVAPAKKGAVEDTPTAVASFGDSRNAPTLGALAFQQTAAPILLQAQQLQALAFAAPTPSIDEMIGAAPSEPMPEAAR